MCLTAKTLTVTKNLKKNFNNYNFYKRVRVKIDDNKIILEAPMRYSTYNSRTLDCGLSDPKALVYKEHTYWDGPRHCASKGIHFYAVPKGKYPKNQDSDYQYIKCTVDVKNIALADEAEAYGGLPEGNLHCVATKIELDSRSLQNLANRVKKNPEPFKHDSYYNDNLNDIECEILDLQDEIDYSFSSIETAKTDIEDLKYDIANFKQNIALTKKALAKKKKEFEQMKKPKKAKVNNKLTLSI